MRKGHFICSLILGLSLPWLGFAQSSESLSEDVTPTESTLVTPMELQKPKANQDFTKNSWSLGSGIESRTEGKDEGFASIVRFDTQFQYQFVTWLKLEAAPYATFYSSRVQERFEDDTYDNRFGLSYGHLTLTPISNLNLKAGAISQDPLNNKQMISSFRSFPGGAVDYEKSLGGNFNFKADAQYVIPTSSSLNTERQDREVLPSFETQSLTLGYKVEGFETNLRGGAFTWSKLPAKVAIESTRAGNLPANGDLEAETNFRYGFKGWFADLNSSIQLGQDYKMGVELKRFKNTEAPENFGDSQFITLKGEVDVRRIGTSLAFGQFFSEAHATPASYASSSLGNTNREGNFVEGGLDFKDYQFRVVGTYVMADVINESPYQDSLKNLSIMVESYEFQF